MFIAGKCLFIAGKCLFITTVVLSTLFSDLYKEKILKSPLLEGR